MCEEKQAPRGVQASLANALDRHFLACAAVATAATVVGSVEHAQATIVYSGTQNVPLTDGSPGIYLNLVTKVSSASPSSAPGWDINPYVNGGSSGTFFGMYLPPGTTPQLVKSSSPTAGGADVAKLAAGTTIGPSSTLIGQPAQFGFMNNATAGDWTGTGSGYMGIQFTEAGVNGGNPMYGWVQISKTVAGEPRAASPLALRSWTGPMMIPARQSPRAQRPCLSRRPSRCLRQALLACVCGVARQSFVAQIPPRPEPGVRSEHLIDLAGPLLQGADPLYVYRVILTMPNPPPLASRVLLIGWDAADWKIISPLMDAGQMPALSGLVERGVMGNISTLRPALSPILWNSIATGKRPDKHGILGFIEPSPDGNGIRPVSSTSRKTKALWNIVTQAGRKAHVVGWYASHPAEPINGVCVSNQFAETAQAHSEKGWPLPGGCVHPPMLRDAIANLRVHPEELSKTDLSLMIPRIDEIDLNADKRPGILAKLMAVGASVHAVATAILENEPWDFTALYYETIDMVGHHFMPYHPPRMAAIDEPDFDLYRNVMTGIYRWHDMMLARLIELAGEDATIILLSDHGFHSDHLRPQSAVANAAEEAVAWHRQHGIFAMAGPNVLRDERIYGATLLDVAPTVLTLLGLPVGADMDGKALVQGFDRAVTIDRIPSWDDLPGEAGMHPADLRQDPVDASEAIRQLVELGYMPPPTSEQYDAMELARVEWKYNLAATQLDAGQPEKADPLDRVYARTTTAEPAVRGFARAVLCQSRTRGGCEAGRRNVDSTEGPYTRDRLVARLGIADLRRARRCTSPPEAQSRPRLIRQPFMP